MVYIELSAILKRTIFCTYERQWDKKLPHLTGEEENFQVRGRRKQLVKIVAR